MKVKVTSERDLVVGDVVVLSSNQGFDRQYAKVIAVTRVGVVVLVTGAAIPIMFTHGGTRLELLSDRYQQTNEVCTVELYR